MTAVRVVAIITVTYYSCCMAILGFISRGITGLESTLQNYYITIMLTLRFIVTAITVINAMMLLYAL